MCLTHFKHFQTKYLNYHSDISHCFHKVLSMCSFISQNLSTRRSVSKFLCVIFECKHCARYAVFLLPRISTLKKHFGSSLAHADFEQSFLDESSSDDDDEITWTCLQRSQKRPHDTYTTKHDVKDSSKTPERKVSEEPKSPTSGKPPRPSLPSASLDRRQRSRSQSNRRERDSKSRSTHSLRDKDLNDKIMISDKLAKENSSSSCSNRRMSPITWEAPPPPPFAPYDYYKHHMSREDLRSMEYYRRPCDPYRNGSCQELYHHPSQLSLSGGSCDNPYYPHYPPPPCCSNHYQGYQGYQVRHSTDFNS